MVGRLPQIAGQYSSGRKKKKHYDDSSCPLNLVLNYDIHDTLSLTLFQTSV